METTPGHRSPTPGHRLPTRRREDLPETSVNEEKEQTPTPERHSLRTELKVLAKKESEKKKMADELAKKQSNQKKMQSKKK